MGYEDDMWGVGENAETSYSKNEIDKMMSDLYEDIMAEVKEVYHTPKQGKSNYFRIHPKRVANKDLIKQKLFEYLNGWLGGPHLYKDKYGTICLTEPHQPYPIGEAQRDQWIACWERALEKIDAPEDFRAMTREPIGRMASFLVNQK